MISSPSWCAAHIHLSPVSLSRGLPKGCVGARQHHRCTPSWCRVSGSRSKPCTSAISAGSEILGFIMITVRVWVRGGAARVAPELLHQVLQRPWGRLRRLHRHRLCGSVNPTFGVQGYVTKHQFTVAALLRDISLGNSGLRRIFFFVICIELQQEGEQSTYNRLYLCIELL
jgi:hypothetical protein